MLEDYKKNISSIKKKQSSVGKKTKLDKGVKYVESFMKYLRENPRLLELWDEIDRRDLLSDDYKSMGIWGKIMYLLENGNLAFGNDPYINNKSNVQILPNNSVKKYQQASISLPQRRVTYASPSSLHMQQRTAQIPQVYHAHHIDNVPHGPHIPQLHYGPYMNQGPRIYQGPYMNQGHHIYQGPYMNQGHQLHNRPRIHQGHQLHNRPRIHQGSVGPIGSYHQRHGQSQYQTQPRRRLSQQHLQQDMVRGEYLGGYKNKAKKGKSKNTKKKKVNVA
jgi:hypothetical protein